MTKFLKTDEAHVADTRAMNPMFRVAAAWQRTPVEELTSEQFESVKHWAVIALALATALATALAALISSLPERGDEPSKLSRMLRAWIARRRRQIYRDVPVPGPVRVKYVHVPVDKETGLVLDPDRSRQ